MLSASMDKNVAYFQALSLLRFSKVNTHCITAFGLFSLKCFQLSNVVVLYLYNLVNTAQRFLCIYEKYVSNKI